MQDFTDFRLGYRSQNNETEPEQLSVTGQIPHWLEGNLIRNGPAKFEIGNNSFHHWFDGLAMLHKFSFAQGTVAYSSKFLHSDAYINAMKSGEISSNEFATNRKVSWLDKLRAPFTFEATDNANINICKTNKQNMAMTETPQPILFDLNSLNTVGKLTYDDSLKAQVNTAHPHFNFSTGTVFNIITSIGPFSKYTIVKIDQHTHKRTPLASIPVHRPGYIHSFALTEKYIVLVEFPFTVNPLELLFSGKPYIENYHWHPEHATKFYLIDLSGNLIGPIESDPCFSFHQVNAYERGNEVVVDLLAYPDPSIIQSLYLNNLLSGSAQIQAARFHRYRINVHDQSMQQETLFTKGLELPTINYKQHNAKGYQYTYAVAQSRDSIYLDELVKLDLDNGKIFSWQQDFCFPGEPIFVARSNNSNEDIKEDDGLILSVVLDTQQQRSFLLILNANNMEEIAQAAMPNIMPFGLHGQFWEN